MKRRQYCDDCFERSSRLWASDASQRKQSQALNPCLYECPGVGMDLSLS